VNGFSAWIATVLNHAQAGFALDLSPKPILAADQHRYSESRVAVARSKPAERLFSRKNHLEYRWQGHVYTSFVLRQLAEQIIRGRIQLRDHILEGRLLGLGQRKLCGYCGHIGLYQAGLYSG